MADSTDSFWPRKSSNKNDCTAEIPTIQVASIPQSTDTYVYENKGKKGLALIFNHYKFNNRQQPPREGTNKDCRYICKVADSFGFDVQVYEDKTYNEIEDVLLAASSMDHNENSCLMVVVMSHGDRGVIHAKDTTYAPEFLWQNFTGNRCPSLAGKPKLFFIQACRGEKVDSGIYVESDTAYLETYKIPEMADILVMYSTYEGYFSWRSGIFGSWFIQSLCQELERSGKEKDILTILTHVNHRLAYQFQSNVPHVASMHNKKQIGTIVSTLTKLLYIGQ